MAYIPKSAIKENQYTPGGEWYYIKNNEEYIGKKMLTLQWGKTILDLVE